MALSVPTQRLAIRWEDVENDTRLLANQLKAIGQWHQIIAIVRGGLIPATLLAHQLNIQRMDTLTISRDDHQIKGPAADGAGVLIVDELVDTGATIQAIRPRYPRAHVAVLYAKPQGRPMADSVVREFPQDIWLDFPWEQDY